MKNWSCRLFRVGLILCPVFFSACQREPVTVSAPDRVCGMRPKQLHGVRLVGAGHEPVFQVFGFPASFMLDNMDSPEAKTCTFELTGPQVRPERLFFRYGEKKREQARLEVVSENRLKVTYPIKAESYGLVSIEPPVEAPEDPFRFHHNGLDFELEGAAFLRREKGIPIVRALGPSFSVHVKNPLATQVPLNILVENISDRLTELQARGVGGPGEYRFNREGKLETRWIGTLKPGEQIWMMARSKALHQPYSFLFGGDIKQALPTFERLVQHARTRGDPLFMLAIGDYTRNSLPAELESFWRVVKRLDFPVYFVKGNHDSLCQGQTHYPRFFGPERFYFLFDEMLFAILDTSERGEQGFELGKAQLDWLRDLLARHRDAAWKFLALHVPPHPLHGDPSRQAHSSNLIESDAAKLKQIAGDFGVAYVLSGHAHLHARKEENGVVYLTSGGGGAPLYSHNPLEGFLIDLRPHLMLFHLSEAGIEEERVTLPEPGPSGPR